MIDRIPPAPFTAPGVRLHAWFGSARSLLRELSRALNKGRTVLRADSGLPAGTRLVLVMSAECLSAPIEVQGTVTAWRVAGTRHEMTLRYAFDPGGQRRHLAEAMGELRLQTHRPRRAPRVPLELPANSPALPRGVRVSVIELSRSGARLRLTGSPLPGLVEGSRLVMRIAGRRAGARTPRRLVLEVRWVGPRRRSGGRPARHVGGRFVDLTPSQQARLAAVLRFEETRPRLELREVGPPSKRRARRPAAGRVKGKRPPPHSRGTRQSRAGSRRPRR